MLKQQKSFQQRTLKYDINYLLSVFNEYDRDNTGYLSKSQLPAFFNKINMKQQYEYLQTYQSTHKFQFDDVLSILGFIQVVEQPSSYVLNFVKILAKYREKCIDKSQSDKGSLNQAKQIGDRIKKITKNQIQRQKNRILAEHDKIYDEMDRTQYNQFHNFQQEWKKYLEEFRTQTQQKLMKTKTQKIRQFSSESQKLAKSAKRRNSLVTSSKLRELIEKKKWLVKQGKYGQAMKVNYMIDNEKKKIQEHQQESLDYTLRKRMQSIKKKNQSALEFIQTSMNMNMKKLMAKKKQGENLMQLRMKNLREQAEKKLNDHVRGQISRLKTLFTRAAR